VARSDAKTSRQPLVPQEHRTGRVSLYPTLHRLEHQAEWKESDSSRAKFYSLTAAGRKQIKSELDNWYRLDSVESHFTVTSREHRQSPLCALLAPPITRDADNSTTNSFFI